MFAEVKQCFVLVEDYLGFGAVREYARGGVRCPDEGCVGSLMAEEVGGWADVVVGPDAKG